MENGKSTIVTDVQDTKTETVDVHSLAKKLANRWSTAEETPSVNEAAEVETPEEVETLEHDTDNNENEAEAEETDAPNTDEPKAPTRRKAADDDEIEYTVNGETKTLSVKDAKKYAGIEASLTQKSQHIAEQAKAYQAKLDDAELVATRAKTVAEQRLAQFANYDWDEASRQFNNGQMTKETYAAIRTEFMNAHNEVEYFKHELGRVKDARLQENQRQTLTKWQESYKILTSPVEQGGIPDFDKVAPELVKFAISQGVSPERINTETDAPTIKAWYHFMQSEKAKSTASVKAKPVVKAPSNTLTTKQAPEQKTGENRGFQNARAKYKQTGDSHDLAAALAARWK